MRYRHVTKESSFPAGVDFKMKMGDGTNVNTAYDANGNILQMQQWGLKLNASAQIDNLAYTYQTNSNKLAKVYDAVSTNNKLGDLLPCRVSSAFGGDVSDGLVGWAVALAALRSINSVT